VELETLCEQLSVDFFFLDNSNAKNINIYISNYICQLMIERDTDYLFIYCDRIIKGDLIERYKLRIINFYPSVLPAHKGLTYPDILDTKIW
jgi:folate-dependent phosphoribosylglycinamide formyltransferase PurN